MKIKLLVAAMAALSPLAASAEDDFYVGVGVTYENDDPARPEPAVDILSGRVEVMTAYALVGYDFNRYVAIEGSFGTGIQGATLNLLYHQIPLDVEVNVDYLASGFGKFTWPVTSRFSVHGRVGWVAFQMEETSHSLDATIEDKRTSDSFSWGGTVAATDRIGVRLDYMIATLDEKDSQDFWLLSTIYRFGGR